MRLASAPALRALHREERSRLGVSFAGVHFVLEGPVELLKAMAEVPLALRLSELPRPAPSSEGDLAEPLASAPVAVVTCVLHAASGAGGLARAGLGPRGVTWEWNGSVGHAATRHAEARWVHRAHGLCAEATLSVSPRAAESLLTVLAAALLHRAGGVILHAASVELSCGVVAFVGPSGAGKSTACEHVVGARQFSVDRLAVAPVKRPGQARTRWVAHPLPGGTPSERGLPASISLGQPLCAILAVHKAPRGWALRNASETQAVARLRASAFHANPGPGAELELLDHLNRLAREVRVADLELSLGTSLEPILSRWLLQGGERDLHAGTGDKLERRHVGAQ
jgi:hypothetical protein